MAIYTRTGDAGSTSLFGGKRVLKCEELVDVYGSIDELNSWVGHIASLFRLLTSNNFFKPYSRIFYHWKCPCRMAENTQGPALKGPKGRTLERELMKWRRGSMCWKKNCRRFEILFFPEDLNLAPTRILFGRFAGASSGKPLHCCRSSLLIRSSSSTSTGFRTCYLCSRGL